MLESGCGGDGHCAYAVNAQRRNLGAHRTQGSSTDKIMRRLWCLPDEMTAEQFLTHLLRQGALQSRLGGNWACPFPSFRLPDPC